MGTHRGVVRWFNNVKGYGFVSCEGEKDIFVHYSAIVTKGYRTLAEGDEVEYDVIQGSKGPQADQVKRARKLAS